ncbi:peptide release factor PrfH [Psychroflexus gondwanensis ACAM 44]|uniref:Peptide release factor PrfH n=1 Tax=Psychroflexus gondwanensis ACAM 44 TaxID=1189619 RepID=N1WUZ9_9FLAO|nr:alternative ribosome rescue aminoacyl-tRNA hydrolase ArfB [Psychroflexus gondwanensis]EMY81012.1 peptide release factor PrfH [Psychroflexus gondwanensis ACAM 44]
MYNKEALLRELEFQFALSGGPGGQHVNKTETKVILIWDLQKSGVFSASQKERLQQRLASKINSEGLLKLNVSKTRSQHQNKKIAILNFEDLVKKALQKKKKRIKTKPSRSAKLKRLQKKKKNSEKKANRQKPEL